MPRDEVGVEAGEHRDAAEDRLGGDAGEHAQRDELEPAAPGPLRQHGVERRDREDHDDEGEQTVAELDEVVDRALVGAHRGEGAGHALGPGRAAEAAAREAHDATGDDDADLGRRGWRRGCRVPSASGMTGRREVTVETSDTNEA